LPDKRGWTGLPLTSRAYLPLELEELQVLLDNQNRKRRKMRKQRRFRLRTVKRAG